MKIVIAGGSGQIGQMLDRFLRAKGHEITVLGRSRTSNPRVVAWDGKNEGPWYDAIERSDVLINLAGRSVNCRYTSENMKQMMDSRVLSTRALGAAVARASQPPKLWLQASTATIYAHTFDCANDEETGMIGGSEPGVPAYWKFSIDIAKAWEGELEAAATPLTRKVALRSAMVMSPDKNGVFDVLSGLTRCGLGGRIGSGEQYVSWIHEHDFCYAIQFLIENESLRGPVNLASPNPLPQREFMKILRDNMGLSLGLPATEWMIMLGAVFMRTDAELVLKSRRVYPKRLLDAGYAFKFDDWERASADLVTRRRELRERTGSGY